jgi:hypothetical protein
MNAYFNTNHVAALLYLVTISAWGMMELSQRRPAQAPRPPRLVIGEQ